MSYVHRSSFVDEPGVPHEQAGAPRTESARIRRMTADEAHRLPLEDLFRFCYGDDYHRPYDEAVTDIKRGRHPSMVRIDVIDALRHSGRLLE